MTADSLQIINDTLTTHIYDTIPYYDTIKAVVIQQTPATGWEKFSKNAWTIAAIAISLSAVIVSILSLYWTRNHNMLSVKPKLDIKILRSPQTSFIKIIIINKGLGPATIVSSKISKGDISEEYFGPIHKKLFSNLEQKIINKPYSEEFTNKTFGPNDEVVLYSFYVGGNVSNFYSIINKLKGFKYEIKYKDIYNKNYTLKNHSTNNEH